jgi:hypothetical protein
MRSVLTPLGLLLLLSGCSSWQPAPEPRTAEENRLFGPVAMKLDTFSRVKDWSGRGAPNGIEAFLEFDDRFGDRTKAAGNVLFELYEYRKEWPDARGLRVVNPWRASLENFDEQKAHWERASGAYTFQLAYDVVRNDKNYVLTATYESGAGQRFFSQVIIPSLVPEEDKHQRHHVEPASQPDHSPTPRLPEP